MKKRSWKFWITFWVLAVIFLTGWFFFWQWKNKGWEGLNPLTNVLPVSQATKTDMQTLTQVADAMLVRDGRERVYLALLQNNTELRPGGGYIGSFAIIKIRDGQVTDFAIHDTNIFDGRIPSTIPPPYPMKETLRIDSWKMRDSNWSPDFPTDALKAEEMYHLGQGGEQFDGIFGVTTNTLVSILKLTGPITLDQYQLTLNPDNVVDTLEYQVEQQWWKDGESIGDRKQVIRALGDAILARVKNFSLKEKQSLFGTFLADLHQKDIQVYFKDGALQNEIDKAGWSGRVDTAWKDDFVSVVDANLSALKTDRLMDRYLDYTVDMTSTNLTAVLAITYKNNGAQKDWRTSDYQSFVRVYVPDGSWLSSVDGAVTQPVFGTELGKKYFGALIQVPLGTERTVTFKYTLPKTMVKEFYDLKFDKQAGVNGATVSVHLLRAGGVMEDKNFTLTQPWVLSEN
ncbi:MAG: DUF4012 domain-containing protein [Candidatus Moraniibacteriota bacterium]